MRHIQQVPCITLNLKGEVQVDFRYPSDNAAHLGETDYWLSRQKRVNPDAALFIGDECRHCGAFPNKEAAVMKLKVTRVKR